MLRVQRKYPGRQGRTCLHLNPGSPRQSARHACSMARFRPSDRSMPPSLRHVCDIDVSVGPIRDLGPTPHGRRRIIPILSGTVKGERLDGEVMPGGADWQYVRGDGVLELEARYSIKTKDGTEIAVTNRGMRRAPPEIMDRLRAARASIPRSSTSARSRCSRLPPARTSGSTAASSSPPPRASRTSANPRVRSALACAQTLFRRHRKLASLCAEARTSEAGQREERR